MPGDWSYALAAVNITVMVIALSGHTRLGAYAYLTAQVPWTIYDVVTHQYGFIIITVASVIVASRTLCRMKSSD